MKIRSAIYAAFLGFGLTTAGGPTVLAGTLEEDLARMLTENPTIRSARKTLEGEREGISVAKSALLPDVSLSSSAERQRISSTSTRGDGQTSQLANASTATLTVTQNLFDGFATDASIRAAEISAKLASISLEGTLQQTLFDAIRGYINVLRQRQIVDIRRESEFRIQRQLQLEDERVRRGSGIAVDVLQAKTRLQTAKERRVQSEGDLQDALTRYQTTFGFPPNPDDMFDPIPPIDSIPSSRDRSITIALTENPAVRTATTNIDLARNSQEEVKSGFYPTVDLQSEFAFDKNESGTLGTGRDYKVGLSASWDLFSGFSTRRELSQASFETAARRDDRETAIRDVEEQVRLAWQALITTRERVGLLENAVNIASEVAESRRKLRAAGQETVTSVLDAENEVNDTQINFTSASYDERIAVYQLLLSLGRLDPLSLNLSVGGQ